MKRHHQRLTIITGTLLLLLLSACQTTVDALRERENKALLQSAYDEVFNQGRLDLLDEQIAENAIDHNFPDLSGVDAFKLPMGGLLNAFPDLQATADIIISEGDIVMAKVTFRGTHQGEFLGIPPTGKQVEWTHVDINRIEGGKVVEAWHIGSGLAILEQLGALGVTE